MELNQILHGDVIAKLLEIPDEFVHTIVTSPPYYALRDYKLKPTQWPAVTWNLFGIEITTPAMECCLGLEPTPHDFIGHMVYIFRLAKRVLKKNGTLWVNIGDSYSAKGKNRTAEQASRASTLNGTTISQQQSLKQQSKVFRNIPFIKKKDLLGIPWMLAFALREDGWFLRQDIIWSKPNPMPESTKDRCTKSHEYIFLLSKSKKYLFDWKAIQEPATGIEDANGFRGGAYINGSTFDNSAGGKRKKSGNKRRVSGEERGCPPGNVSNVASSVPWEGNTRNKRDVSSVAVKPFAEAHFATFPPELITDCIKAGCPADGVVLDPFMGAGTTAVVSRKLGRNFIGIDLSETYINDIANPRLVKELGLFI